jgi:thiamine biosynthesis lipoprotein
MGTIVTIHVVQPAGALVDAAIDRAFGWFREIEACCSRFRGDSELTRLTTQIGAPVPVSAIVFEVVRFALMVAEESGGAFDPAVRGGNYRDVELGPDRQTITLRRPLTLDLGGVAKGLAVDTAARELAPFRDFAIDAGGDLYLGGLNPQGSPWSVGIRHPRRDRELIGTVRVSNQAVCTSGDYERPNHLIDPRSGAVADSVASATVIADGAMLADALATAAFVLGPVEGISLLARLGVEGMIVTPSLERFETEGFCDVA